MLTDVCPDGLTWTLLVGNIRKFAVDTMAFLPSGSLTAQENEIEWDKDGVGQTCLFSLSSFPLEECGRAENLITAFISIGGTKPVSECITYKCVSRKTTVSCRGRWFRGREKGEARFFISASWWELSCVQLSGFQDGERIKCQSWFVYKTLWESTKWLLYYITKSDKIYAFLN